MREFTLKQRVGLELSVVGTLTTAFLLVFPKRPMLVDVALALFALVLLVINIKSTRETIWTRFPPCLTGPDATRNSLGLAGGVTVACVIACLMIGFWQGYVHGGWEAAGARVGNWHIVLAVACYLPWALLQQTLFQFYLLGRLLVILPPWMAVTCTGLAYSLVHLPDYGLTLATAATGVFWTWLYYRYRRLLPLALSHACLGSAFYYWVYERDLVRELHSLLGQ